MTLIDLVVGKQRLLDHMHLILRDLQTTGQNLTSKRDKNKRTNTSQFFVYVEYNFFF